MANGETPIARGALVRIQGAAIQDTYRFQYNPTETAQDMGVKWFLTKSPGQYLPVAVFSHFSEIRRTFELFLFSRDHADSRGRGFGRSTDQEQARLELFCSPGPDFGIRNPKFVAPSRAKLVQGSRVWNGVVESLKFREQMYNRQYDVTVSRISVSFLVTSSGFAAELAYLDRLRARAGV